MATYIISLLSLEVKKIIKNIKHYVLWTKAMLLWAQVIEVLTAITLLNGNISKNNNNKKSDIIIMT